MGRTAKADEKNRIASQIVRLAADQHTPATVDRAKDLDHALLHELLERGPRRSRGQKYPTHWLMKRVDEVAEVGSGLTLGKDVSGFKSVELPYLRVANV